MKMLTLTGVILDGGGDEINACVGWLNPRKRNGILVYSQNLCAKESQG